MTFKPDLKFVAKACFEALMIVFAVLLAFLVTEWRAENREKERARLAIERIVLELEANLAELDRVGDYHSETGRLMADYVSQIEAGEVPARGLFMREAIEVMPRGINPPQLNRTAWEYALASGVLDPVEYDVVADLAAVYGIQANGVDSTWRQMASGMFMNEENMTEGDLAPRFALLGLMFRELSSQEDYLVQLSVEAHEEACGWLGNRVEDGRCVLATGG